MSDHAPDFLIYGSPVSPFARKVMALAIEKGQTFDVNTVSFLDPPSWFETVSPMKRIPILRDRSIAPEGDHSSADGTIADSSAICGYIEKKHPTPALYPDEPYAHGRALFLEEYADTVLAPAAGLHIFRPIFFSMMSGKEPDVETAKKGWAEGMPPVLDFLEAQLDGANYFVGDTMSIADVAITCMFMQITLVAKAPLDAWPGL
ncbi:MAG: glutathione S-transferase family protein, partial [Pseudomonadota bacterium]